MTDSAQDARMENREQGNSPAKGAVRAESNAPASGYDPETGLPVSKEYFERGLPPYLQTSLRNMIESWKIEDSGQRDWHWDIAWCDLNADINAAEADRVISAEQAWYLREKFLRMERI